MCKLKSNAVSSSANSVFTSEKVPTQTVTFTAKMQTVFDIPVTLYYYPVEKGYLEKLVKVKLLGYKEGQKSLIGETKINVSKLANNNSSMFDPMLELIGENGKPCQVFLAVEAKFDSLKGSGPDSTAPSLRSITQPGRQLSNESQSGKPENSGTNGVVKERSGSVSFCGFISSRLRYLKR